MATPIGVLLAVGLLIGCTSQKTYPLLPPSGPGPDMLHVGDTIHVGPAPFMVKEDHGGIRWLSARLVVVPANGTEVRIVAVEETENDGQTIAFGRGPIDPSIKTHPVNEVTLKEDVSLQWQLVAEVRFLLPGLYTITSMRVTSESSGQRITDEFPLGLIFRVLE